MTTALKSTSTANHNPNKSDLEKTLESILPDKADAPDVAKIINQYKTKQGVNNGLTKKFPQQKVGPIYKAIKRVDKLPHITTEKVHAMANVMEDEYKGDFTKHLR